MNVEATHTNLTHLHTYTQLRKASPTHPHTPHPSPPPTHPRKASPTHPHTPHPSPPPTHPRKASPTHPSPPPTHPRKATLIIQDAQNPKRPLADEIETRLVVLEVDCLPADTLGPVPFLLQAEDVMIEVELELLVGKVDAQLLKTVLLKILKES